MRQPRATHVDEFSVSRFEVTAVLWLYRARLVLGWPNARAAFAPDVVWARIGLTLLLCMCLPAVRGLLPYSHDTLLQSGDTLQNIALAPTATEPPFTPTREATPQNLVAPFAAGVPTLLTLETVPPPTLLPPTFFAVPPTPPPPATRIIAFATNTLMPRTTPPRSVPPASATTPPTIRVSVPTTLNSPFVVQPGDSLWTIAQRINVPVEQIATLNHLALNSRIYAGQTLLLPVALNSEVALPTNPPFNVPLTPLGAVTGTATIPPLGAPATFVWPVRGIITTYYTPPLHPAIDIGVPMNTPILASASGTVTYAAWSTVGYGNFVIVDHGNGYVSRYAHLSRYEARVGQVLAQGQVLGYIGSTGNSTGPHLHFEILYNGVPLNPLVLLGG